MHPNKEEDVGEECKELATGTSKKLSDQKRRGGETPRNRNRINIQIEIWIENGFENSSN